MGRLLRLAYDVVVFVVASLLAAWGLWLLVTDPDGGRPVGALALMVGALGVLVAVLGLRRHRRRSTR
jgi:hypothetical protein